MKSKKELVKKSILPYRFSVHHFYEPSLSLTRLVNRLQVDTKSLVYVYVNFVRPPWKSIENPPFFSYLLPSRTLISSQNALTKG